MWLGCAENHDSLASSLHGRAASLEKEMRRDTVKKEVSTHTQKSAL